MTIGDNRHSLLSEYIGYSDDLVHEKLEEFVREPRVRAGRIGQALRSNIRQLKLQENGDLDQLRRQIWLSEKDMAQKYQQSRTLKALPQKLTQLRRSSLNAEQDPALRKEFALNVFHFYEYSRSAGILQFGVYFDDHWCHLFMEYVTGMSPKLTEEELFEKHFKAVKGLVDFITYMEKHEEEWSKWNKEYTEYRGTDFWEYWLSPVPRNLRLSGTDFWEEKSILRWDRWDQENMSLILSRID